MTTAVSKPKGITLVQNGRYPIVPLNRIEVVERPEFGKEADQLFFNPRRIDSFTPDKMKSLRDSIQADGLHKPLIVRAFTADKTRTGLITRVELVAGERRFRSLNHLYEANALCYDDETESQVSARQLYAGVPCRVLFNITDKDALRVAFQENNEHHGLTVQEEIELVERLLAKNLRQEEIVVLLGTNITWVSQTLNFRKQLPDAAFSKLVQGKLARHVAVQILSYKPEDREALYDAAVDEERRQTDEARSKFKSEVEQAEDELSIAEATSEIAQSEGDETTLTKSNKRKETATKRLQQASTRLNRVEEEAGTMRQGHLQRAAQDNALKPKKNKMLDRRSIEQFYFDLINGWTLKGKVDNITKLKIPKDILEVISATAQGILAGEADPGQVIRTIMARRGEWKVELQHQMDQGLPDGEGDDDDDEDDDGDEE